LKHIENKKKEEELAKSKVEKEVRENQIREKNEKKIDEFASNRTKDRYTIEAIKSRTELETQKELEKQIIAKKTLKRMLQDNEDFKQRQILEKLCERQDEIKSMQEYKKILDKQEQDRADYFRRCEGRQLQAMNRMAETVIKKDKEKMKEEEQMLSRYQSEKDKR